MRNRRFGTSGWRVIALDENGEWVVGEFNWPPSLPNAVLA